MQSRNCAVCVQLFSGSLSVMSLLAGGLLAMWDAPGCFSVLYEIGPHQTFGDMHLNTRKRKKKK